MNEEPTPSTLAAEGAGGPPALEPAWLAFRERQFDRALVHATALHEQAVAEREGVLAAEAALLAAKAYANQSRNVQALGWAERAAVHADALPPTESVAVECQAQAQALVAAEYARAGRPSQAMHAVGRVLPLLGSVRTPRVRATVYNGLCFTYIALCMPERALEAVRRALAAALVLDDDVTRLRCTVNLINAGLETHDLRRGEDPAAAAELLKELHGHALWLRDRWHGLPQRDETGRASWVEVLSRVLVRMGELQTARAMLEEQVQREWVAMPYQMRDYFIDLGRVQHACGDAQAARRSAQVALSWHAQVDRPAGLNELDHIAAMHELAGDLPAALALTRERLTRTHRVVLGALQARVDELSTQFGAQSLRLENAELVQMASTDALTGLPNRRALQALWEQPAAETSSVVAMLDLDFFKAINDRFSHAVGDLVLREAAQVMGRALRTSDRLFRYGGEEFLVLLPGTTLPDALPVLERLRLRMQTHEWSRVAPDLQVTVSLGATPLPAGQTLAAAAVRADAQLYRAKAEGRNRVVHSAQAVLR